MITHHGLERSPQQDPIKPQESPDKINPPGTGEPSDQPRKQPDPNNNPIA